MKSVEFVYQAELHLVVPVQVQVVLPCIQNSTHVHSDHSTGPRMPPPLGYGIQALSGPYRYD